MSARNQSRVRRWPLALGTLIVGAAIDADVGRANENEDPASYVLPAEPQYGELQRLRFAGIDSGGTYAKLPDQIDIFFRAEEFDLRPSSLQFWINGVEYTESLRFWVDRAWLELPPDSPWIEDGENRLHAMIQDPSGNYHHEINDFGYYPPPGGGHTWPFSPTGEPNVVSNNMPAWQSFAGFGGPYWHRGVDLRADAGTSVHAAASGEVVQIAHYLGGPEYWSVGILEENEKYVWQYHHIDPATITVVEGQMVQAGDLLGQIITWQWQENDPVDGLKPYHHLHLNVVNWEGPGSIPGPYVDGFRYHNPFLFFTQGSYADAEDPTILQQVYFADNESDVAYAASLDPGTPVLGGNVDMFTRMWETMTTIPGVSGQPYALSLYQISWGVEPLDTDCGLAWVPGTLLGRFDQVPGGAVNANHRDLLHQVYQGDFSYDGVTYTTEYDYDTRRYYYNVTNGFFGTIDSERGYWNTDRVSPLGVHFPDGTYDVSIYARDFHGNLDVTSVEVEVVNGLEPSTFCPDDISGAYFLSPITLENEDGRVFNATPNDLPIVFGAPSEGSTQALIPHDQWPVLEFDLPLARVLAVGVLAGNSVAVEYVPQLGDVIFEIPAEIQRYTDAEEFDHDAPSTDPVTLRLSTRLARDPWTGQPRIGSPHAVQQPDFELVMAEEFEFISQTWQLRSADGGTTAGWSIQPVSVSSEEPAPPAPSRLQMRAGPTPFATDMTVSVSQPTQGPLTVQVWDIQGRLVQTLYDGSHPAGDAHFSWDGRSASGVEQPAGVYFVSARRPGTTISRRVVRTP